MGRIYSKAQKEQINKFADEVLEYLESIRGEDNWKDLLINKLESMKEEKNCWRRMSTKSTHGIFPRRKHSLSLLLRER